MLRRTFLKYSLAGGSLSCSFSACVLHPQSATAVQLQQADIAGLQHAMQSGQLSASELCHYYLHRIRNLDQTGPSVNSVIELNSDALAIAAELDQERHHHGPRGPLHGIPILLKDNIDTGDRMQTTAGSLAMVGNPAPQDAFLAHALRKAGAVILGKTNLSEWANFRSTRSSSGWSSRGGQTKNPYALRRNPCGSSSGSAAAVAADFCAASIGTETDGSIVCPASSNGIVGLKPTLGLISRSGIIPIAHSQDTAGPMTRSVRDAAILLTALAATDTHDPATQNQPKTLDYTKFLHIHGLRNAHIGVARNFFGFDPRVDTIMNSAIEILRQQGATVIDPANIEHSDEYGNSEYEVLLYEFKHDLNRYLKRRGNAPMQTLADIITFNEQHKTQVMPYFGQEIFLAAQTKGPLSETAYREALQKNHLLTREKGIDATLQKHRLDALIAPTGGPAWLTDHINGDHFTGSSSSAAAVAGYPNITVPAGFVHGLPVGISFIGGAYREAQLLQYAYAFEQASQARRPPTFAERIS